MMNLGTVIIAVSMTGSSEIAAVFGNTVILLYHLPISTHFMQVIVAQPDKGAMLLSLLSAYISAYAALAWILCRAATPRARRAVNAEPGLTADPNRTTIAD